MFGSRIGRLGSHPAGLWVVKHVISPVDRVVVAVSGGRLPPLSSVALPTLLLTVVGRRSGQKRTVPLVYVRDGERYVVGNARPAGERGNPWILNLRAAQRGTIQTRGHAVAVAARELDETQIERWWPLCSKCLRRRRVLGERGPHPGQGTRTSFPRT